MAKQSTTATPTVNRSNGTLAWRKVIDGKTMYCPRAPEQDEPAPWAIWSWRLRDVGPGDVAGSAGPQYGPGPATR